MARGHGLVTVAVVMAMLCVGSWDLPGAMAKNDGQALDLAKRMAKTSIDLWGVVGPGKDRFQYELGVMLRGVELVWKATSEKKYFDYVKFKVDRHVQQNGSIANYNLTEYSLDNVMTGKIVLFLYEETKQWKYKGAADILRQQLRQHPRNKEGGFWHKLVYPNQMWLDGAYMAEPFYAQYAKLFEQGAFQDIAWQFILMEIRTRDPRSGLLYHGYDESRAMNWSDPKTGRSPSFWGRSVGWYFVALVDTLDYFPADHPKRSELMGILSRLAVAVKNVQDPKTGLWWQVLDMPRRPGNYLESSASAMFVYSYAKGVRKGYLPYKYLPVAKKGYAGIVSNFVVKLADGGLNYTRICGVGGLGGNPYRNGTFEYYISEPIVTNDPKGVGPFMMASVEISYVQ